VISATFPEDNFSFTSSDRPSLDPDSLNNFLTTVRKFIDVSFDVTTAMSLVAFTVVATIRTKYPFDTTRTYIFEQEGPIDVASYSCKVTGSI